MVLVMQGIKLILMHKAKVSVLKLILSFCVLVLQIRRICVFNSARDSRWEHSCEFHHSNI